MSTSKKIPATIRQGGPGASHEDATEPLAINKPQPGKARPHHHSRVSGGGGEQDSHHTHDPPEKGGHSNT